MQQQHPSNRPPATSESWNRQADPEFAPARDAGSPDAGPSLELVTIREARTNPIFEINPPAIPLSLNSFGGDLLCGSDQDPVAGLSSPLSPPSPGNCRWMETIAERTSPDIAPNQSASGVLSPAEPSLSEIGCEVSAEFADSFESLLHDARNLVTTLDLYCDLLDMPGVLEPPSHHYAGELRLIAIGSHRILDKLLARAAREDGNSPDPMACLQSAAGEAATRQIAEASLPRPRFWPQSSSGDQSGDQLRDHSDAHSDGLSGGGHADTRLGGLDLHRLYRDRALTVRAASLNPHPGGAFQQISSTVDSLARGPRWRPFVAGPPIQNLAEEVLANHNLLCALAGPGITVGLSLYDGKRPVPISADDLTRMLVNLVKNASEAMPEGGHIQVALEEFADHLSLSVSDTGVGIPESSLEAIFTAGFTTRVDAAEDEAGRAGWPAPHRGMGLAIVRSIMAAAGGSVCAANRHDGPVTLLRQTGESAARKIAALPVSGAVVRLRFPLPS